MGRSRPLADRIALVTGASRGIGAATALALARTGAHVVAVARSADALSELEQRIRAAGSSATLMPLDVSNSDAIARLAATLTDRFHRLDVLVANAGVLGPICPLPQVELAAWQEVMTVNVTANYLLIRGLDSLLRHSDAGRAGFITSSIVSLARADSAAYAASKGALELMVRTYANETASTSLRVNLFNPGPTRTQMRAERFPNEDPMTLDTPAQVAEKILELCLPSFGETGKIYDYRYKKLLSYRPPG
jgi:NAD(P)-dependent dehydrogenase (short-subunit alcohol dehydrogenase family)